MKKQESGKKESKFKLHEGRLLIIYNLKFKKLDNRNFLKKYNAPKIFLSWIPALRLSLSKKERKIKLNKLLNSLMNR